MAGDIELRTPMDDDLAAAGSSRREDRDLDPPVVRWPDGQTTVEGPWVDQTVGLNDVRADIAMMRTPDGHGRVELSRFHTPPAVRAEPESAPANTLGIRRIMFASTTSTTSLPACAATVPNSSARSRSTRTSTGSASCVALRASSSDWPSSCETSWRTRPACVAGSPIKRRGWDSNPRSRLTRDSGFQDRRIRPLCHPSVVRLRRADGRAPRARSMQEIMDARPRN